MNGEKGLTKKIANRLTAYVDERFEDYRNQITMDLSKGLAALSGVIVIWTIIILIVVFIGITLSFFLGKVLNSNTYGFLIVTGVMIIGGSLIMLRRKALVESRVLEIAKRALRVDEQIGQGKEELMKEALERIEDERKEN